jgi:hypothetical protein
MLEQALFLSCGLMTLGIILGIIGGLGLRSAAASLRWRPTPGEVLSSGVEQRDGRPTARVRYRYRVGEKTFTGARITYRAGTSLPGLPADPPEAAAARYPRGAQITVYHDPGDPARAVLEPGAGPGAYLPIAAGGLFFVLGLIAGIAGLG